MKFLSLWPLIFLVCIPIIIILWLLKQKASDHPFSSLYLWKEAYKNNEASTPWEKFKNHLLMYLQILTVLVLIFAMASPYIPGIGRQVSRVILAIDTSGSMNAIYDNTQTRFEAAIGNAEKYIDSLSADASVTLVTLGAKNTIELASTDDKTKIKQALNDLEPTDTSLKMNVSLDFLNSMAASMEDNTVVVFSDQSIDTTGYQNMEIYNMSSVGVNAAVDYVSHSILADKLVILAQISNYSDMPYEGDVNLYIDGKLMDISTISLDANANKAVYFELALTEGEIIKVQLNNEDILLRDNVGFTFMESASERKVLLASDKNVFLDKSLTAIGNIDIYKTSDTNISEDYDIYIFDGMYPDKIPEDGSLVYINPPSNDDDFINIASQVENIWLTADDNELMQYIYPLDIAVSSFKVLEKPSWAKSMWNSSEGCGGYYGDYNGRFIAVLGFDLHDTDFALQTQFPIFINNLMDLCKNSRLTLKDKYAAGDKVDLNAGLNGGPVKMLTPDGDLVTLESNKATPPLLKSGVYQFTQAVADEVRTSLVHVDFPTDMESKITGSQNTSANANGKIPSDNMEGLGYNLRNICILICILLLMVEWTIYLRRI